MLTVLVAAIRVFDLVLIATPGSIQDDVDVVGLHWWRIGNEHPAGHVDPAAAAGCVHGDQRARAALERHRETPGPSGGYFLCRSLAGRRGAVAGARRGGGAAAEGLIDLSAEKARLDKEIVKADADIKRVDAKLGNEKFVANAPEEIVEEEKEKREAAVERKTKLQEALERLKKAS